MPVIESLRALEILDSRGRPTIQTTCRLKGGGGGTASVPSGASTGKAEAVELRDGDPKRYRGLGCRQAVAKVNEVLHPALAGKAIDGQSELDRSLLEIDGTPGKSKLGANAILSASLSFARAAASQEGRPLYRYLGDLLGAPPAGMPRPAINLFSGGKHAGGQCCIQDVLIVALSARTTDEVLSVTAEVYAAASDLIKRKYGMRPLVADEGGLAPAFPSSEWMLKDAMDAIGAAGLRAGQDVGLAVDIASSHFYADGFYRLDGERLDADGMIQRLVDWTGSYPVVSVEDGLSEEDWDNWPKLRTRLPRMCRVVGDDLLCTNPRRIERAISSQSADSLLLKVNQIGTLTEALEAHRLARAAGWQVMVSARSGETEDDWLADLAVGWQGNQIKIGSITRSERLSKYNRLLAIQAETGLPIL